MWISLWIHILWNATKPLPLTLSIPVPLWLFKLVNSNSIFKSAELSLTYCKEDSISETLFLLSEGQRAHRRICLLRTEIPSCLVKDIKQHCKWSFSLSVPPLKLPLCVHMNIFTFQSVPPPSEFMAVQQRPRLCYVSAETAWPHALVPSATRSPDKTDIYPEGRHKSGLLFRRELWKSPE